MFAFFPPCINKYINAILLAFIIVYYIVTFLIFALAPGNATTILGNSFYLPMRRAYSIVLISEHVGSSRCLFLEVLCFLGISDLSPVSSLEMPSVWGGTWVKGQHD